MSQTIATAISSRRDTIKSLDHIVERLMWEDISHVSEDAQTLVFQVIAIEPRKLTSKSVEMCNFTFAESSYGCEYAHIREVLPYSLGRGMKSAILRILANAQSTRSIGAQLLVVRAGLLLLANPEIQDKIGLDSAVIIHQLQSNKDPVSFDALYTASFVA